MTCDTHVTSRSGDAARVCAERGREYDVVFSLGGDGTSMEVLGALAYSNIPVGVLPGGTGNLLSRALGIPSRMKRAVPALLGGTERTIDLGLVHGRHFAVAAGVGIDAAMVAETKAWMKRHLGVTGYTLVAVRAALRSVLGRKFFTVRIEVDGQVLERQATSVVFANFGAILEDRLSFGPDIRPDDGLLDCCIFAPASLGEAVRIMWCAMRGIPQSPASVTYAKGARFRVETLPSLPLQADGDLVGTTSAELIVQQGAARLLLPRQRGQ